MPAVRGGRTIAEFFVGESVMGSKSLLDRWRRRYWRPSSDTQRYNGMQPFVVVTGGSRGIGLEFAREFSAKGHPVLMIAREPAELEKAAAGIRREGGPEILTLALDLSGPLAAQRIETLLAGRSAYADILVNNAGIGLGGPFASQTADELQQLIGLNIAVLTQLSRYFLPGMLARGAGGILNVGSLAGYVPGPYQAAYYASKAYVISLTEALAREVAGLGVRIAMINPGAVATSFHAAMGTEQAYYLKVFGWISPVHVARVGYRGFRQGRTLIVPGLFNYLMLGLLRIIPHPVSLRIMALLLHRRGTRGTR